MQPKPSVPAPQSVLEWLEAYQLEILANQCRKHGVGSVASGRAMVCNVDHFDPVFEKLGLKDPADPVFSMVYTSLGQLTAILWTALIDPLGGHVQVLAGPGRKKPDEVIFIHIELAQQIDAVVADMGEPDQEMDIQGRNLASALRKTLGPLDHGCCYGSTWPMDDPHAFDVSKWQLIDAVKYIHHRNDQDPFERVVIGRS